MLICLRWRESSRTSESRIHFVLNKSTFLLRFPKELLTRKEMFEGLILVFEETDMLTRLSFSTIRNNPRIATSICTQRMWSA